MHSSVLIMVMVWMASASLVIAAPYRSADGQELRLERIGSGFGVVWGMSFVSDRELLITERQGRIGVVDVIDGSFRPISGGPEVLASGQGGLLDVAVEPGYAQGGYLYFTYVKAVGKNRGVTTLARARLVDDRLTEWQDVLITRSETGTTKHYGSRIAFDGAGHVFFSVGDRGERELAQDLGSHAGTVLRVHLDGSVPQDNPLIGVVGALPEIWSWGHRNIQGIAYDGKNNRLWAIEHGPRGGDELNVILPGRNYGWPVVSHGMEYWGPIPVGEARERQDMESPVKVYIPSIAPSSLLVYDGGAFDSWRGSLLAGSLVLRHLNRITVDGQGRAVGEERLLEDLGERIRSLAVDAAGMLYLATDSGLILRLVPAS